jgi:hypothetical protein
MGNYPASIWVPLTCGLESIKCLPSLHNPLQLVRLRLDGGLDLYLLLARLL